MHHRELLEVFGYLVAGVRVTIFNLRGLALLPLLSFRFQLYLLISDGQLVGSIFFMS